MRMVTLKEATKPSLGCEEIIKFFKMMKTYHDEALPRFLSGALLPFFFWLSLLKPNSRTRKRVNPKPGFLVVKAVVIPLFLKTSPKPQPVPSMQGTKNPKGSTLKNLCA